LLQTEENPRGVFLDSFRYFHPNQREAFTCWRTVSGARETNFGTRIDYILGDVALVKAAFEECVLMPEVKGSDHCPVKATLKWECLPNKKCPPLCTKYLPEFLGKQQKLSSYFTKGTLVKSESDCSSQESVDSVKSGLSKRCSDSSISQSSKKQKLGAKKQGNLLSFFSQPKSNSTVTAAGETPKSSTSITTSTALSTTSVKEKSAPQSVNSWKAIFKGPLPAPLCKGHQEACVLRTVKKDSLNKGRQFWVCNRPEGHKSNKEARCEHFEWVMKK
jgi:AP endonuclease-2